VKEDKMAGHVACMGEMRNAYKIFIRKPEVTRPCGRPRCRWEEDIIIDVREIW
jgi:hypothetical protein